ncbi:MAG: periplasmic heavy metal sensor [candidate division NC10 bacterium]|nr:periplasmic heavy metal sensor [candidate division NC10 bacterium]
MRSRLWILMTATLSLALALPASGQMMGQTGQGGPAGPMPGGMMGGMMHGIMGQGMAPGMREGRGGHRSSHEGPLISMMLEYKQELGLSAEQEIKLRDLRTEFAKDSIRRTAEIRVAEIDLNSLLEQDKWDLAKIEPKVKQIAGLKGELRLARLKTLAAGRAVLTADQLEKFKQVGHRMRSSGGPGAMGPGMMGPGHQMGPGMPGAGGPPAPRY